MAAILFGDDARQKLFAGIFQAAQAIAVTYGPRGSHVLIQRYAGLVVTKDGATVAREVDPVDPFEKMGAKLLRQACLKVEQEAGDGTSTVALLTLALAARVFPLVVAGEDPTTLCRDLRGVLPTVYEILSEISERIQGQSAIQEIAMIATNNDEEVSRLLAEAVMTVGQDGMVLVEGGKTRGCLLDYRDGMLLDTGYASPYFAENNGEWRRTNCLIILSAEPVTNGNQMLQVYIEAQKRGQNNILLIAPYVEGEAVAPLVNSKLRGNLSLCAVKAPGGPVYRRDLLDDLAALTGATVVDPAAGMPIDEFKFEWAGEVEEAKVRNSNTLLVADEDRRNAINKRIQMLKAELLIADLTSHQDMLKKRIANLTGGLCILRVGGDTEAALKERRARIEDALGSIGAALDAGIVPGGGMALLTISEALEDEAVLGRAPNMAERALSKALRDVPGRLFQQGASDGRYHIHKAVEARQASGDPDWFWWGWDIRQGQIRNLKESPQIVDTYTAVSGAIQAAISVVATACLVEVAICPEPKK